MPAIRWCEAGRLKPQQHLTAPLQEVHALVHTHGRDDLVGAAELLEDAQDFVVAIAARGNWVELGAPIGRHNGQAVAGGETGERGTDRPEADHEEVGDLTALLVFAHGVVACAHLTSSSARSSGTRNSVGKFGPHAFATCSNPIGPRRRNHSSSSSMRSRSE